MLTNSQLNVFYNVINATGKWWILLIFAASRDTTTNFHSIQNVFDKVNNNKQFKRLQPTGISHSDTDLHTTFCEIARRPQTSHVEVSRSLSRLPSRNASCLQCLPAATIVASVLLARLGIHVHSSNSRHQSQLL